MTRTSSWPRSAALGIALLIAAVQAVEAATVVRGPYLQLGTPTSIVVRWRTDSATDSVVRYGPTPSSLGSTASDPASTTEHVVTIRGLQPDTAYCYSVGTSSATLAGGDADHCFRTSPTPGTRKPYRVWIIGDAGTANSKQAAVRDAYYNLTGSRPTDVWLQLGDNAYSDGTDSEYQKAVFDMYRALLRKTVTWPTLGNHDGHTADSATQSGPYYDIFTLPKAGEAGGVPSGTEAYYSFDYGNMHFICLDSYESDRSTSGPMLTWLKQDLMNTDSDWIIAFWHHPPYSKGSHDSDSSGAMTDMRKNVLPILEQYGVDLVFTGHSHSYERSFLLDGHYGTSGTLTDDTKLDAGSGRTDGDGAYEKPSARQAPHEGAVYVVAGSSGQTSGGSLDHPAMYISWNRLGSVVLDVDGDRIHARFINEAGAVLDYFTLVKNTSTPPQADFSGSPKSGPAPLAVSFTDRSTTNASSWAWDFDNNGTTDSTEQHPTYVYTVEGTYTVRLTVANGSGTDAEVKVGYVVVGNPGPPDTTPPSAPTGLTASAVSHTQIDLAWNPSTDDVGVTGYKVLRSMTSGGPYTQVGSASGTSYSDTGLAASTTYYYVVQAQDAAGNTSGNSNQASATTLAGPQPPSAPSGLSATATSSFDIYLSWTDNSSNESGFRIERKTGASGTYSEIATVGADTTSYGDTGLQPATSYTYRVRAFNSVGDSSYSNEATATTAPPPPPGAILLSDDFEDGVADGWTAVTGAWSVETDGTKVYRQSSTTGDSASLSGAASWTDYSVEARVKPLSFNSAGGFARIYGRWKDASNWYYAVLRSANVLELKKYVNGSSTLLTSKPFTVTPGTWYTLKLEMVGSSLRVYVNGVLELSATDATFTSGQFAVGGFNASVQFDDVVVRSAAADTSPPAAPVQLRRTDRR